MWTQTILGCSRPRRAMTIAVLVSLFVYPAFLHAQTEELRTVQGLGRLSFPTSTHTPAAQTAFLRGVLLLHVFEYPETAAAFQKAQRLDPAFAMAYWGEAMTYNHPVWNQQDASAARAALAKLAPTPKGRAEKAPTARERAYLAALETLYGDGPKARRDTLYSEATAQLVRDYPADDEARAFYALSLLGLSQAVRVVPTYLRAAAIAESVFVRNPQHPGAAHYWIHGMDDPEHAAQALPAARALSEIAPDAGHAQHMTSHIFLALGMWDDVVRANETAIGVVDAQRKARGSDPVRCGHYPSWLEYGYLQQGRLQAARQILESCRDRALETSGPSAGGLDPDNAALFSFTAMWTRYLLDAGDQGSDVAGWSFDPGHAAAPRFTYWLARGMAASRMRDPEATRAALAALQRARGELEASFAEEGQPSPEQEEYRNRMQVLDLELQALVAAGDEHTDSAVALLRRATDIEDAMAYAFGPPYVDKPSHELLGEMLLEVGAVDDARSEFTKALARTPRRTAALLGRARAERAAGDTADALATYTELSEIWHAADDGLPGLAEARRFLATRLERSPSRR